jgi:Zn-dependent protease
MFGWGRPVNVNPNNFQNPRWGNALVAFAGPLANLMMAFIALLLVHVVPLEFLNLAQMFAVANTFMAVFNLLPFPQFDGWRIVQPLLHLPEEIVYWGGGWFWTIALLILINTPSFMLALSFITDVVLGILMFSAGLKA